MLTLKSLTLSLNFVPQLCHFFPHALKLMQQMSKVNVIHAIKGVAGEKYSGRSEHHWKAFYVGLVFARPLLSLMPNTTVNDSISAVENSFSRFYGLRVVKVCAHLYDRVVHDQVHLVVHVP